MYTDDDRPRTIAEISRELGLGRETVREHLIRAQVPRRAPKARSSRDEQMMHQAAQLYREGQTLWEIAEAMDRTATTVRTWLIQAGVERRKPGVPVDEENLRETVRLYVEEDLTIDEVAERQGLHPWTVRQRLVNAQVPRRPRGRRARLPLAAISVEHAPEPGTTGGLDDAAALLDDVAEAQNQAGMPRRAPRTAPPPGDGDSALEGLDAIYQSVLAGSDGRGRSGVPDDDPQ